MEQMKAADNRTQSLMRLSRALCLRSLDTSSHGVSRIPYSSAQGGCPSSANILACRFYYGKLACGPQAQLRYNRLSPRILHSSFGTPLIVSLAENATRWVSQTRIPFLFILLLQVSVRDLKPHQAAWMFNEPSVAAQR